MVVYNSMDKDSFEEAKKLCMELTDRMQKPMVLLIALLHAHRCYSESDSNYNMVVG